MAPQKPVLVPTVLVDANGTPISGSNPLPTDQTTSSPGTVITSQADTVVGIGATVALPAIPTGTRRMTVQVTGGDETTEIRIREVSGVAGSGTLLVNKGSRVYGGADGAVAALEAENVAGPASAVMVQFERD